MTWDAIETAPPNRTIFVGRWGDAVRVTAIFSGKTWRHAESLQPICFIPNCWHELPPRPPAEPQVARDGIEAQRGLNDTWPGDPYP